MIRIQVVYRTVLPLVIVFPCLAAAEDAKPWFLSSDGRAGVRVYVPGSWAMLGVSLVNPSDQAVEVLSSAYFGGQPDLQYARRLWIPARAQLKAWQPVLVPLENSEGKDSLELKSILMTDSSREVIRTPTGAMIYDGRVGLRRDRPVMAILGDPDDADERDAAGAMCVVVNQNHTLARLDDRRLPVDVAFLDGVDQLVIASNRVGADAAAWTAIRRWLHGGGRVWVVLDQVEPAAVALLLGDAFRCDVVDRVGLTQVEIQRVSSRDTDTASPRRAMDPPVDFVRVVTKGFRVTHAVNGWPAALWLPAGRGQLLITTLGARGWIRPRTPADPRPIDGSADQLPVANEALRDLASEFCRRHERSDHPDRLGHLVSEQIGYEVVSQGVVIAILGGFCASLVICVLWLARIGQLQRMGWIGPALAILAACPLGLAGRSARTAVPPSVAVAQLAEADPDVNELRVTGWMAFYQPDAGKPGLGAERGGVFSLDMEGLAGTTRRMVWTDFDRWHWENVALPSGVRAASFCCATATDRPIRARAAFGPEGLTGAIESGPLGKLEDPIITTGWSRNLAVRLAAGGRFVARADDVLAPGQYIQGTMLSQRQQWTQQMVGHLLDDRAVRQRHRTTPAVLARAAPVDTHLGLLEDVERLGGAMATIPLELQRPSAKTPVLIPSLFLPCRCVEFPHDSNLSSAFSNLTGEWLGPLIAPTRALLRFQCPAQVLPLRCRTAKLTVAIQAPSRTMTILGIEDGKVVELARVESPIGTRQFIIDRNSVLKLDREGGLRLGISVGAMQTKTASEITARGWKIDEVQLEVSGETGSE